MIDNNYITITCIIRYQTISIMSRYPTQTNCYLQYLPAWEVVVLLFEFLPGTNIMSIILNIKRDERTLTVLRGGKQTLLTIEKTSLSTYLSASEKLAI